MIIYMNAALTGILPLRRRVEIEAPDNATVEDVLDLYIQEYDVGDALGKLGGTHILINGARGSLKEKLKDKDRVKLFKPLIRG